MNKRMVLVIGPESSGTRMLTSAIIASGYYGDGTHKQRLDELEKPQQDKIVLRRSFPHSKQWPNIQKIINKYRKLSYQVKIIIIIRSLRATCLSTLGHHTNRPEKALKRSKEAILKIFCQLSTLDNTQFIYTTYESLVNDKAELQYICDYIDAPLPNFEIYNGNEKYD